MYRYEKVSVGIVCNFGPVGKLDKLIGRACVHDLHLVAIFLADLASKTFCHIEHYGLFIGELAFTAYIFTAVAGIDHHDKWLALLGYACEESRH